MAKMRPPVPFSREYLGAAIPMCMETKVVAIGQQAQALDGAGGTLGIC